MSFRCQITKRIFWEPLNKIVAQTRQKVYTKWVLNEETRQMEEVEVGRGFETCKELLLSPEGVQIWTAWSEPERASFLKHLR